jgi:hypothetical protein
MRQVKVYLDDREKGGRRLVQCELIESRPTTIVVKLPDGNVITRKKSRDLPKENSDETV